MRQKAQISTVHLGTAVALFTLGGPLLYLPVLALEAGGRIAWLITVGAGIAGFLILWAFGKLGQRFPTLSLGEFAERILGKWPGKILGFAFAVMLGLGGSVELRMSLDAVMGLYFVRTPSWIVALLLVFTALSLTWFGIVSACRLGPILAGLLLLTFLFTFPLLYRWIDVGYLLPVFDMSDFTPASRVFWASLGAFRVAGFPAAFMPSIAEPGRALRTFSLGYWSGWLGVMLAVVTPILLFGPEGAQAMGQPFLFAVGVIRLPNWPFERVELLARMLYNLTILYAIAIRYIAGGSLMARVFGTKSVRPFMLVMAAVSLAPLLLIRGEVPGELLVGWTLVVTLFLEVAALALLWLAYWLRGMHRRSSPGPNQQPSC